MYRNGRKSKKMELGEAKSKLTNSFPLRKVVGCWSFIRLCSVYYTPILECGHIDLDNSTFVIRNVLFWRDGWKLTKFRCISCAGLSSQANLSLVKCQCDYEKKFFNLNSNKLIESLDEMTQQGIYLGKNFFQINQIGTQLMEVIKDLSNSLNLNADKECKAFLNRKTNELSIKLANSFIQHLESLKTKNI